MKFVKTNIADVKGRQPSKYDSLLEEFKQPGDALYFSEEDCSKQKASSIARRFRELTGKKFHSFFDVRERKTCIRLRMPNELGGSDEVNGDSDTDSEVDSGIEGPPGDLEE